MMQIAPERERRVRALEASGARNGVVEELLAYGESGFDTAGLSASRDYPLADEAFVPTWERFAREAETEGAVAVLRRNLVQLRFPVERGMSSRAEYVAATRRGVLPRIDGFAPPELSDPSGVSIALHPTPAGRLPVVFTRARADFELLVRALTRHNEPEPVPPSMGACIVGGYNNWGRVAALRQAWTRRQSAISAPVDEAVWLRELDRIVPQRELYQDRFVVLSAGPYSGTRAASLGLEDGEWLTLSRVIRLEHECAHYFTRRVFGSMRNSLLDELIADYTGIVAAAGRFEPAWLLRFLGVDGPTFREEGRLVNYRGTPPLSDAGFAVLRELVRRAAATLARFDALVRAGIPRPTSPRAPPDVARAITVMAAAGLERLTTPNAAYELFAAYCGRSVRELPTSPVMVATD